MNSRPKRRAALSQATEAVGQTAENMWLNEDAHA
jgi:hypothetical protein